MESKIISTAIAQINGPIQTFLETGVFHQHNWFIRQCGLDGSAPEVELVPHVTVTKLARLLAKELRRPFITAGLIGSTHEWKDGRWQPLPRAEISGGWIKIPRRKYLMPIAAPLIAATIGDAPSRWSTTPRMSGVHGRHGVGHWWFELIGVDLYEGYLEKMRTDEYLRAAMRLPNLKG